MELRSDVNVPPDLPGTAAGTLLGSATGTVNGTNDVTVTLSPTPTLATGTQYWAVFYGTGTSGVRWRDITSTAAPVAKFTPSTWALAGNGTSAKSAGPDNENMSLSVDGNISVPGTTLARITNNDPNRNTAARVLALPKPGGGGDVVIVTYIDIPGAQAPRDIYVSVSTDSGATFSAPTQLNTPQSTTANDSFHFDVAAIVNGAAVEYAIVWEELSPSTLARNVRVRRTANILAGAPTWSAIQTFNKGAGSPLAGRPRLVYLANGRIVSVWREQRANQTEDLFTNFWDDAQAAPNATDVTLDADATNVADAPVIAANGSEVYIAYQDLKPGNADIGFFRTLGNVPPAAPVWSPKVDLDDGTSPGSATPQIAAVTETAVPGVGEHRVYVVWQDNRSGTEIYAVRSTDAGATFGTSKRVSSVTNPAPGASAQPKLVADASNRVTVVYTSTRSGKTDIYGGFSMDGGLTWQPKDVRADTGTPGSATSKDPAIALRAAGGAFVTWVDFRSSQTAGDNANGDIYFNLIGP
jgi:hypothetical protein